MRNVTISLDEALVRRAKVEAAKQDKSLSKYISELVARELGQDSGEPGHSPEYQAARAALLAQKPYIKKDPNTPWLTREEAHDRSALRRHERAAVLEERPEQGEEGGGYSVD